jgi:L-cysteine/cystine lyase
VTDPTAFRAEFPVLARFAYLNAGTDGPIPQAAADAVRGRMAEETMHGRVGPAHFEQSRTLAASVRAGYADVLGTQPIEVALTGSTTDGVNTVIGGLALGSGDEILTTDQEHPGLLAPLRRARLVRGVTIRSVPFEEIAGEVGRRTRLVACSHVSWVGGAVVDVDAIKAAGVPLLLDAAQALGAVPIDVHALGCDFYAASGQKWLCGPDGSGCLWVAPERLDELEPPWPGYGTLSDHLDCLESGLTDGVPRLDHGFPPAVRSVWALASLNVLRDAGWAWVHERASTLAQRLADLLRERGKTVLPRGNSTLVSWETTEPEADVERLRGLGMLLRSIPTHGVIRASVGAWTSEEELERLARVA